MAPSSSHPTLVGHSVHGLDRQTALQLHQQALERTIQSSLTLIDDSDQKPHKRNFHNKKKKKYYPWIQRDSLARRERIGNPGSRRRQRHDNGKWKEMKNLCND
ncbi:hypothetical protein BGW42_001758 [Actinomortierella wolfii]|nr:hypothetical protein BGW42_001758 [Actinomortierella wolfii]